MLAIRKRAFNKRGQWLGKIEKIALEQRRIGDLPDWTVDFGRHAGKKLRTLPLNYVFWAAKNGSSVPRHIRQEILRCLDIPQTLEQLAEERRRALKKEFSHTGGGLFSASQT